MTKTGFHHGPIVAEKQVEPGRCERDAHVMETHPITVGPVADHEAFLRTDHTVWFSEVGREPPAEQLLGVPARFRYAAQVDGADPDTYPASTASVR